MSKVNQLQLLQQNLQNIVAQKQQIEEQLSELNSASTELKTTEKAYKIIGKIMIAASPLEMAKELDERKEFAQVRLKNFTKQEEQLKQDMEKMQKEVMEEIK